MVNMTDSMEIIWSQLTNQIIQHVYRLKPHFWVFAFRAKSNGLLILNFQNEHPVFSIQSRNEHPLLSNFSEPGLTDKLKGFQINRISLSDHRAILMSMTQDNQSFMLKVQLAPFAPRFQIIKVDEIVYDSILGWQPKSEIKSKPSHLVIDDSLELDWVIRYSFSIDYLDIVHKTLLRKKKRQSALEEDLKLHIKSLEYQAIAEAIQLQPNQPWNSYPNPFKLLPPHPNFKCDFEGINELFQLVKKAKKGTKLTQLQIKLNLGFIDNLTSYSKLMPPLSVEDLATLKTFLEKEHLLSGVESKPTVVLHHSPYYVEFQGVRFSYGKNAKQNHHLTFSIAKKSDIFMHLEGKPGSHLIIHHSQFDHELIIKGAQLVLALANQFSGTITYAKVGSLKQTKTMGLVMIKDAKKIKANANPEFSNQILEQSKRY
ncbi:MAG: hypothetical protein RLZZ388_38 [Bacillota bacterium]|jgi:hypothetical protein